MFPGPHNAFLWWRSLRLATTICVLSASPLSAWAQGACSGTRVSLSPPAPRQGAFFLVRLAGVPDGAQLSGVAAGEVLHFIPGKEGPLTAQALAGTGADAPLQVEVRVVCTVAEASDTLTVKTSLQPGAYAVERLRVDPQFASTPDSVLAKRIERESQRARAVARESHATPRLWQLPFQPPRMARITSEYGRAREFNGEITSRHLGTDFAGATGAPVAAINRGVVRIVDAFFYGGNVVYVDHGDGVSSAYLHLSQALVTTGDTVERGEVIGRVGATGRVTGPHLHLITRFGNMSLDPISLLHTAGDSAATAGLLAIRERPRSAPPKRPRKGRR